MRHRSLNKALRKRKKRICIINQGISYHEIPMIANHPNIDAIVAAITDKTRMVHVQRSCGYSSVSAFIEVFRTWTGKTPGQWVIKEGPFGRR